MLHQLMVRMTEHWGHLVPAAPAPAQVEAPEAPPSAAAPPSGGEEPVAASADDAPSSPCMVAASRAILQAEREAILQLGYILGCLDTCGK